MGAITLALSAALCWGMANFLGGLETRRLRGLVVVLASQALGLVALITVALLGGGITVGAESLAAAATAGAAAAVGLTAFYRALSIGTMGVVAPIGATGVAVPVLVGLGDGGGLSIAQGVGLTGMAVGVLLAMRDGATDEDERQRSRQSIMLAWLAALAFGVALTALDRAAAGGALTAIACARAVTVIVLGATVAVGAVSLRGARRRLRGLLAIGILEAGATACYALATTTGHLSIVAMVSSLYPIVTVLLARMVLGEHLRPVQTAGIATALLGVGLVAAG